MLSTDEKDKLDLEEFYRKSEREYFLYVVGIVVVIVLVIYLFIG